MAATAKQTQVRGVRVPASDVTEGVRLVQRGGSVAQVATVEVHDKTRRFLDAKGQTLARPRHETQVSVHPDDVPSTDQDDAAPAELSPADQLAKLSALPDGQRGTVHQREARKLVRDHGLDMPEWAMTQREVKARADARVKAPAQDRRRKSPDADVLAARYANGGKGQMKGQGPAAPVNGPNVSALRTALGKAGIATDQDGDAMLAGVLAYGAEDGKAACAPGTLRSFATGGRDQLPGDASRALRGFVKESAGIDGGTFYGRKLARMLVAIADQLDGKAPTQEDADDAS